jgi:hypothetical protein
MNLWWRALPCVLVSACLLPDAHAAAPTTAADALAQLQTLTRQHVYRGSQYAEGIPYTRETIRRLDFEPSRGWLGITVDDTAETAPVAVIMPRREASMASTADTFSFSCSTPCITTTRDSFAGGDQEAVVTLADIAKRPASRPSAKTPDPTGITAGLVARINALTERLDYNAPDGTRVLAYRYRTTLNLEKRELTVVRDVESFVATDPRGARLQVRTTIPLSDVSVSTFPARSHRPRGLTLQVHEVGFICLQKKSCVQSTAPATGARNTYQAYAYETEPAKMQDLKETLEMLLRFVKGPRP